jgi:hypothetical protein
VGDWVRGTDGFSRKRFDVELLVLGRESKVGRSSLIPALIAPLVTREENHRLDCVPLVRDIVRDTHADGEIRGVLVPEGRVLPSTTLEFMQYALAENIVEVMRRLDAALPEPASGLFLEGYAIYRLERAEWPALLSFVQRVLGTPVELAALTTDHVDELINAGEHTASMAASILLHAHARKLDVIEIEDRRASLEADNFWELVRGDWGPPIFGRNPPEALDPLFARGLVLHFSGDSDGAKQALERSHAAGDPRARRWLSALGVTVPDLAPSAVRYCPPTPLPDDGFIAEALADDDALEDARQALDGDRAQAVAAFNRLSERGKTKLCGRDSAILNAALDHGTSAEIAAVFDHMRRAHPDGPTDGVMAYNFACASARLGDKPATLGWLRAARMLGDDITSAATDKDFAAYHDDADFRKLVG